MPLNSKDSPDEQNSPFYLENKQQCADWQTYITEKGGQLNGTYNSWSFYLKAKVAAHHIWEIEVKKSTYSNGSLIFSSKKQNLLEVLTCRVLIKDSRCEHFKIRRPRYSSKVGRNTIYVKLVDVIKPAIEDQSLQEVSFKDQELTLILHHKNNWF